MLLLTISEIDVCESVKVISKIISEKEQEKSKKN